MCEFCLVFDFSSYRAKVEQGVAVLEKAPTDIPFLPKQQFKFCPMCGYPINTSEQKPHNNFGQNLRRIRRMRGYTQAMVGRELGVQRAEISKYEKGHRVPNVKQIAILCKVLNVNSQELL